MSYEKDYQIASEIVEMLAGQGCFVSASEHEGIAAIIHKRSRMVWDVHNQCWADGSNAGRTAKPIVIGGKDV